MENFKFDQYNHLDVKDRAVLDIGANIGDTAIYFAINGARHVYAVEPSPYMYVAAKRNVKLNGLHDKITLLNEGIGGKPATVSLSKEKTTGSSKLIKGGSDSKPVKISTLKELVERYNIQDGVLKIDCEGYEYESVLNSDNSILRRFTQIDLEYHNGYIDLERKLKDAGFDVKHSLPRPVLYDKAMVNGIIRADRK